MCDSEKAGGGPIFSLLHAFGYTYPRDLASLNQIAHAYQVVSRCRKLEHPLHPRLTAVPHPAHHPDCLQPPEDLLYQLPFAQADGISRMPRRPTVDAAPALAGVLGHVRRDV